MMSPLEVAAALQYWALLWLWALQGLEQNREVQSLFLCFHPMLSRSRISA